LFLSIFFFYNFVFYNIFFSWLPVKYIPLLHEYSGEDWGALVARPSPEYECRKRNLFCPIWATSFLSIVMYLTCTINDVIIYKIKNKSWDEQVYLIFLLQHWSNS
jgi:hypothetical protein